MSDRICFKSNKNEDISKLRLPEIIGSNARYEKERDLIFTYIKTIEFYGDRQYGISPDREYVEAVTNWAKENNLDITSDYDEQ